MDEERQTVFAFLSNQKVASFQIDEEKHLQMDIFPLYEKRMVHLENIEIDETNGNIIMGEENRHYFIYLFWDTVNDYCIYMEEIEYESPDDYLDPFMGKGAEKRKTKKK